MNNWLYDSIIDQEIPYEFEQREANDDSNRRGSRSRRRRHRSRATTHGGQDRSHEHNYGFTNEGDSGSHISVNSSGQYNRGGRLRSNHQRSSGRRRSGMDDDISDGDGSHSQNSYNRSRSGRGRFNGREGSNNDSVNQFRGRRQGDHEQHRRGDTEVSLPRRRTAGQEATTSQTRRLQHWEKYEVHDLAKQNATEIVCRIQNEEEAFLNAFKYDKFLESSSMLKSLIRILHSIIICHDENVLPLTCRLISLIVDSCDKFMSKLREFIMTIQSNDVVPWLKFVLDIAQFTLKHIPDSTITRFPHGDFKMKFEMLLTWPDCRNVHQLQSDFDCYIQEHFLKFDEYTKRSQPLQKHSELVPMHYMDDLHDQPPPDDYHDCDILPESNEISDPDYEPFLRSNLINRDYHDAEHYLDVQFRLLREDFIGPLREGIASLDDERPELRVYRGVHILEPICLFNGIGFLIQFSPSLSRCERVHWEHSQRLIYGSLVCFSSDKFKTILFASIVKREPEKLKNGQLIVKFEGERNHLLAFNTNPNQEYAMVESDAYFEAYRHVLEGLKDIVPDQMPFKPYLVKGCDRQSVSPPPPLYLHQNSVFHISSDVLGGSAIGCRIDVTDPNDWLRASRQTGLNVSQLEALRVSLSQEISVIQGPPGTGKTFIGLKIMHALLENRHIWDPKSNSPILVMCYTNHALDQFLEGILKLLIDGSHPNVVRIGGRCKNESLKQFILGNIVNGLRSKKQFPKALAGHFTKKRKQMEGDQDSFESIMGNIELMSESVLSLEELKNVISEEHRLQLLNGTGSFEFCIEMWLQLMNSPAIGNSDDSSDKSTSEEEELIEVMDTPQLLEEDRREFGEEAEFDMDSFRRRKERKIRKLKEVKKSPLEDVKDWQIVTKNLSAKQKQKMVAKKMKETPMTDEEVLAVGNVWALSLDERWKLYLNWKNEFIMCSKTDLSEIADDYNSSAVECMRLKEEMNLAAISDVHVVGMTTTGAAKHSYLLNKLHPKIVIVEEAAEVMEAHIVTSLCSSVQQLILIGDHKQLQPKPAYYPLEKQYNFNISLFERLIKKKIPCVTLNTQHRMRPEIARIVGNHIYDELYDSESVKKYEKVKGVEKSLFFIEHKHRENSSGLDDSRSRSNTFEAQYVRSLTRYFLQQGYKPQQITVLTMYRGQLIEIKTNMPKNEFGGVRVAAVDDYQGEENDIIILSLVRSNLQNSIGFLKIENRVCVALSRAKKGMFVIGNFSMLRDKNKTKWPAILEEMEEKGFLGDGLPLCCQNHPEQKIIAKSPDDFSRAPAGGCTRKCGGRLACGHECPSICHPVDLEHKKFYKCIRECRKRLNCGHVCTRKCFQCANNCGPCLTKIENHLPCGHIASIPCSKNPRDHKCTEICNKPIDGCGHPCTNKCSDQCLTADKCKTPCETLLNCSHKCKGTCSKCHKGRLHVRCFEKCDRILACGHACKFPCTPNCPPCNEKCRNYCFHSKCPKKCFEPCVPCREPCKWKCEHYECTALCGQMCNRPPCNRPCRKLLKCGHPCIGLCGEDCPILCRICDKEKVTEVFFGTEDEENARFIQLKDCHHILEVSGLDHWMKQDDIQGAIQFKECPKCKTPIRRSLRYGNIVKRAIDDMEKIKKKEMSYQLDTQAFSYATVESLISECSIDPVLSELVASIQKTIAAGLKPHNINTLQTQLSIVPKLLQLVKHILSLSNSNPVSTFGMVSIHQSSLLSDLHVVMRFMKVPFLTSQQKNDMEAEIIRLHCLTQLCRLQSTMYTYYGGRMVFDSPTEIESLVKLLKEMGCREKRKPNMQMQEHIESRIQYWCNEYRLGGLS